MSPYLQQRVSEIFSNTLEIGLIVFGIVLGFGSAILILFVVGRAVL
jgi:hypothetical protein